MKEERDKLRKANSPRQYRSKNTKTSDTSIADRARKERFKRLIEARDKHDS